VNWFFDQVLYKAYACDYSLAKIENKSVYDPAGYVNSTDTCVQRDGIPYTIYNSKVIVHRLGEVSVPLEVKIVFEDGTEVMELWDGKARSHEFVYSKKVRVKHADIDPLRKIDLDKNFLNNSKSIELQENGLNALSNKFLYYFQNFLQTISFFS